MTELAIVARHGVDIEGLLNADPRLVSKHTKTAYRRDLAAFTSWRGAQGVTKSLVEMYLADLRDQGKSVATINRALSAIRWYARKSVDAARENEELDDLQRLRLVDLATSVAAIQSIRQPQGPPKGRAVSSGELKALMQTCDGDGPGNIRDAALIGLGWTTGARRSELANLQTEDIEALDDGAYQITIHGKGGKVRQLVIDNGAADALADWLAMIPDHKGPVFLAVNRGGRIHTENREDGGISAVALGAMLTSRAQRAQIKPLTWHDLRRTLAGDLLDAGVDIATAAKVLGHSSVITTQRYDRRDSRAQRAALQTRHVPYTKRLLFK